MREAPPASPAGALEHLRRLYTSNRMCTTITYAGLEPDMAMRAILEEIDTLVLKPAYAVLPMLDYCPSEVLASPSAQLLVCLRQRIPAAFGVPGFTDLLLGPIYATLTGMSTAEQGASIRTASILANRLCLIGPAPPVSQPTAPYLDAARRAGAAHGPPNPSAPPAPRRPQDKPAPAATPSAPAGRWAKAYIVGLETVGMTEAFIREHLTAGDLDRLLSPMYLGGSYRLSLIQRAHYHHLGDRLGLMLCFATESARGAFMKGKGIKLKNLPGTLGQWTPRGPSSPTVEQVTARLQRMAGVAPAKAPAPAAAPTHSPSSGQSDSQSGSQPDSEEDSTAGSTADSTASSAYCNQEDSQEGSQEGSQQQGGFHGSQQDTQDGGQEGSQESSDEGNLHHGCSAMETSSLSSHGSSDGSNHSSDSARRPLPGVGFSGAVTSSQESNGTPPPPGPLDAGQLARALQDAGANRGIGPPQGRGKRCKAQKHKSQKKRHCQQQQLARMAGGTH